MVTIDNDRMTQQTSIITASDALVLLDYHEAEKVELFCDRKKEQKEQRRQWRKDVWGRKK